MLELNGIGKSFGESHVLNDINLTLDKGRIMSILGPSGGGKTTLLNIILGITDASEGRILYDGDDLTNTPMERRGFNIVFQDYALFPNLNAYENIVYGLRNKPDISSPEEIKDMIRLLDLEDHLGKSIDELSGGQKQRVALARTLVMKPRLLLLDEPLSALDGVIKESIKAKIRQIVEQFELTTIMVTHDPEEACTMSDRVLILNKGTIAQYDTPENIIEHPADDFVRSFILRQLEVKRDSIYALFDADADTDAQQDAAEEQASADEHPRGEGRPSALRDAAMQEA
ncbi:MAG: ABC transporter ATP-binding protein [Bifidobacterium tibiigranuli]|jgi:iron(III) transport system ATP-binding protein|nr:ABC transporter ATP-binding protein [Bifidobacterium tibiigranuli]